MFSSFVEWKYKPFDHEGILVLTMNMTTLVVDLKATQFVAAARWILWRVGTAPGSFELRKSICKAMRVTELFHFGSSVLCCNAHIGLSSHPLLINPSSTPNTKLI